MKQESANDPTATTWSAKVIAARTVDMNYYADSSLQTISRTQGTAGTTPIVSTYTQTTDNVKNEGHIALIVRNAMLGPSRATWRKGFCLVGSRLSIRFRYQERFIRGTNQSARGPGGR